MRPKPTLKGILISPSQLANWRACKRIWAFDKIDRLPSVSTDKQNFGTNVHKILEDWLTKGTKIPNTPEGACAKQLVKPGWMPAPSKNIMAETLIEIPLVKDEIGIIGYSDLVEPPSLISPPIVDDFKTTSDLKWAMTEDKLAEDAQALIYAAWAMIRFGVKEAIARWLYAAASNPKNGPRKPKGSRKVEHRFAIDDPVFVTAWEAVCQDVFDIAVAKKTWKSANEDAPPNPSICASHYGGCKLIGVCNVDPHDRLASYIIPEKELPKTGNSVTVNTQEKPVATLMEKIKAAKARKAGNPPPPDPEVAAALTVVETPTPEPASAPAPAAAPSPLLARLQQMSAKKGVNPPEGNGGETGESVSPSVPVETVPVPAETTKAAPAKKPAGGVCPGCGKEFKVLRMHKCKAAETAPEIAATEQEAKDLLNKSAVAENASDMATNPGKVAATEGIMLLIDCAIRKSTGGAIINLTDWVAPIAQIVASDNGLEHFGLVDFAKGGPMLAAKVDRYLTERPQNGTILMDGGSLEGRALRDVMIRHATIVIQGTR